MREPLAAWQTALRDHVFRELKSSTLLALEVELASGGHGLCHRPQSDPEASDLCVLRYCACLEVGAKTSGETDAWLIQLGKDVGSWRIGHVLRYWDSRWEAMPELHDSCTREAFLAEVRLELTSRAERKTA